MRAEPFEYVADEAALVDLGRRLAATRWPDEIDAAGWRYGTSLGYLRDLAEYWRTDFDWRAREHELNAVPQFRATIDGERLHFVHVRGCGPRPLPLILCHGWPSSFVEMLPLVPLLTDPASHGGDAADSFDVVIPSLPGYGHSGRPRSPGMTKTRIAALFARLMRETLGYGRFAARGGDIGSGVCAFMALDHPEALLGIHVSDAVRPWLGEGSTPLSDAERKFLAEEAQWMREEGAYDYIQATKPQTLAYGLNDSPAGLAAWIVEKFRAWSDCDGDVERRFTRDELLTNVTLYWLTETINSANRLYFERDHHPRILGPADRIGVPCAVTLWPADIDHPPREYAERVYNVQRWRQMPRGGHFPAMEEPDLLAEDLREFFRPLRPAG